MKIPENSRDVGRQALDGAKQAWNKILKWWKNIIKWNIVITVWTSKALKNTLVSGWEIVAAWVSKVKENRPEITKSEKEKQKQRTRHYVANSREHIIEAWKASKVATRWFKKAVEWWVDMAVWTFEIGSKLIEAWDNAIWDRLQRIKNKKWNDEYDKWKDRYNKWYESSTIVNKIGDFMRYKVLTSSLIALLLWFWWAKIVNHNYNNRKTDNIEVVEWKNQNEILQDFFWSMNTLEDLGWSGKKWQTKRRENYLWKNEEWNNMRGCFWKAEINKVIGWFCRMIRSWHLEMILKKADEAWVPRECVFIALVESWWEPEADSWKAWWYRQFTEQSWKDFGAIDDQWNDYRSDPEKSTEAAMKHLLANYDIVCNYAKRYGFKMSESDKWIFASYMYNWSPKLVRTWMVACKWNVNEYSNKQENGENRNYAPRVLWLEEAIENMFEECEYDTDEVEFRYLKTAADTKFEEFLKNKSNLSKEQNLKKLEVIRDKYTEEYNAGIISLKHYERDIGRVNEEILLYMYDEAI